MIVDRSLALKRAVQTLQPHDFDALEMGVFRFQAVHCEVYARYMQYLGIDPLSIHHPDKIPFLPIGLYKTHDIQTGSWSPQTIYTSSGTTGSIPSRHLVREEAFYLQHTLRGFTSFYGDIRDYLVIALLPSYLEREGSSLIAMMSYLIGKAQPGSGFFLRQNSQWFQKITTARRQGIKVWLVGVSYALLDLAEKTEMDWQDVMIMETGGMKGRRLEWIRPALHEFLCRQFHVDAIHSEYGMTELFSQAYAQRDGIFRPTPAMRVRSRPVNDPLGRETFGKTGVLNITDLANIDTCCFIATDDLGAVFPDGSFTVTGRMDNSDIRGCNLMVE